MPILVRPAVRAILLGLLTLSAVLAFAPDATNAQTRPYFRERAERPVTKGDRLRVVRAGARPAELFGDLLSVNRRSILIDTSSFGDTVRVAVAEIEVLERYAGVSSRAGSGAAIGALSGVGIGVIIGSVIVADSDPHWDYLGVLAGVYVGAGLAALGAVIGAIAGSNMRYHRWEPATTEDVEFALRRLPGNEDDARKPPGVGLALRWKF